MARKKTVVEDTTNNILEAEEVSTPKTRKTTKVKVNIGEETIAEAKVENSNTNSEVEMLKKQIEELQKMVLQSQNLQPQATVTPTVVLQTNQRYIKVTSMVNGLVTLTTGSYGRGKPFNIDKLLGTIQILDTDLRNIIDSNHGLITKGVIYIEDESFIDEKGLRPEFENKITPSEMREFYSYKNDAKCLEIFNKATEFQRRSMFLKFCSDCSTNTTISANLMDKIGKLMGKNVFEMVETSKQYEEIYEQDREDKGNRKSTMIG